MNYAIGIDLGGSSVKAVAATPEGETLSQQNLEFNLSGNMDWAETIRSLARDIQLLQKTPASWLGLAAPGLASADHRAIAYLPGRLQGLERLDWTDYLRAPRPVPVLNDAHAALLGEAWLGAARGFKHVIMLTLGTGVGGAAIVDGRLLCGRLGRAGHLGHASLDPDGPQDICGTPGSLETVIGNCTIEQRSRGAFKSTHELVAAHLQGDPTATAAWLKSVKGLAAAICSFINILDPEAVIVGGGIARSGEALFQPLRSFLDPIEWRPGGDQAQIVPAQLGEFAGAYGAAHHAMNPSLR